MKLSAVIITKNEEKNIKDCLECLRFCDELILVDSGSTDQTVSLAKAFGATVHEREFRDFASQKNYGIEKAGGEWVLLVDADERVSEPLAGEIQKVLKNPEATGYYFLRKNRLFGRWMRFGNNRRDYQLRLVLRKKAIFQGFVHERIYLSEKTVKLKESLLHYSTNHVSDYMKKLNTYAFLEAETLRLKGRRVSLRQMKYRPLVLFFRLAFIKAAVLDGIEGVIFSVFSAYYEFIRLAKQWELNSKNGANT